LRVKIGAKYRSVLIEKCANVWAKLSVVAVSVGGSGLLIIAVSVVNAVANVASTGAS